MLYRNVNKILLAMGMGAGSWERGTGDIFLPYAILNYIKLYFTIV